MTLFVKKYQSKNRKNNSFGKTYARTTMIGTIGIEEMADLLSEMCTVTRHDIVAVLSALGPTMSRQLQQSKRVQLPYLGTFKLGVTTKGEENEEDFDVKHNVKNVHVNFHPETTTNAQGKWVNSLTRGVIVGELPKNLKEVTANSGNSGTGGNSGDNQTSPDQPDVERP
jgi:predicted histone-like DNA-binding protein